jgi:hypothetical protein
MVPNWVATLKSWEDILILPPSLKNRTSSIAICCIWIELCNDTQIFLSVQESVKLELLKVEIDRLPPRGGQVKLRALFRSSMEFRSQSGLIIIPYYSKCPRGVLLSIGLPSRLSRTTILRLKDDWVHWPPRGGQSCDPIRTYELWPSSLNLVASEVDHVKLSPIESAEGRGGGSCTFCV